MRLPRYSGPLAPAPWSGVPFSEETTILLRRAAEKNCPVCQGKGYLNGRKNVIHLCHCVNRPAEKPEKRRLAAP